ncbi:MAG: 3-methyl-2-oxobutanoate hydroxymethyltransferase [Betaproteobacteria bacterium TMED156]|nr:MAG: 3-methyl-2-oxobutanoate hydroxymethyltransferase [Betaproteobacteria bacterium TMED156]
MTINIQQLIKQKKIGLPICMLTCYDATFAKLLDKCGVEIILVGDSLGMVVQGNSSTIKVKMSDMIYHTRCVSKAAKNAMVMVDMPFGSYQESPRQAYSNAALLMEAGAKIIKLEGGEWLAETVSFLSDRGIPTCAHLGLTPQSVHKLGGYKIQGKSLENAEKIVRAAKILEGSGVDLIVLELIPTELGKRISKLISIPTIGIGAGVYVDGQVLVLHDILGLTPSPNPRFVKSFFYSGDSIEQAIKNYILAVKEKKYPDSSNSY